MLDEVRGGEVLPIVYSSNNRIFHGIVLSVLSILKRTQNPIEVYLLTMDLTFLDPRFEAISQKQAKSLDDVVKSYNPANRVILLDATNEFLERLGKSKNLKTGFTPYTIMRLLLDIMPVPDKVIYLDVDTMCCADIKQLYDIDVSEYELAMVLDAVGRYWVRPTYCNAGVILLNIKEIRASHLFERAIAYVNKRKLFMPDQSAINFKAKRKLIIPRRFNEQRTIKDDTVVKHFCQYFKWYGPVFKLKNVKQWEFDKVHEILNIHDFDDVFDKFIELDKIYNFKQS